MLGHENIQSRSYGRKSIPAHDAVDPRERTPRGISEIRRSRVEVARAPRLSLFR